MFYPSRDRFLIPSHRNTLRKLTAHRHFNVSVDAHIDNDGAVFDGKSFIDLAEIVWIDLAEIVWPIDPETLSAKADGQFSKSS